MKMTKLEGNENQNGRGTYDLMTNISSLISRNDYLAQFFWVTAETGVTYIFVDLPIGLDNLDVKTL